MNARQNHDETLFHEAMQLATPEARAAFLAEACGEDSALRQRVEALLQAASKTNDFLEAPVCAPSPGTGMVVTLPIAEKPGDRIGHYKLLEQIGEGGCGVVYMAEQTEPIRRRVALKVVKLGMDTKQVIGRFEAERQALALMDHPNIARVLDAGATETGRPYFVMELVRGIKITDYCDQHSLSTKERLDLFMQVCHAVQHAHQKGIIHRDLKPSNILVTLHDGVPVPKVIDFGIAKATQQPLTDKTLFTAFQQFIGTPAYMSPEQAELSGLDIDTRSDIYSLGVLLYELLTGKPPFEPETLLKAGFDEMRRIIRETEPPKPSTRLATALATTPHSRRADAPSQRAALCTPHLKEVRGDLDWIVMKCLEKDRARRYETASGLAQDVKRHLENEPVTAAAPGAFYRIGKFVRRNRTGLSTATALVLLLLAGVAVGIWQAVRASKAELEARTVVTFLDMSMEGLQPALASGRDTTLLREILDRMAARVDKDFKDQPKLQAGLWGPIAEALEAFGEHNKAVELMRTALATAKQLHGSEHPKVADALDSLGAVLARTGELAEAEKVFRESLTMKKKLLGKKHSEIAWSLNAIGGVQLYEGKVGEAESTLREAVALDKTLHGDQRGRLAPDLSLLAMTLTKQGKLKEAEALYREELPLRRKQSGGEQAEVYSVLSSLVSVLKDQGKLTEAEVLCRESLAERRKLFGPEHPRVASWISELAAVLQKQGRLPEAETLYRESLAMRKKVLGSEHPEVVRSLYDLASLFEEQSKGAEAEALYREALAADKKRLGEGNLKAACYLQNVACRLEEQHRMAAAEAAYRESLAMHRKLGGPDHEHVPSALTGLAGALREEGKLAEAEAVFREELALRKKLVGNEHPDVADSLMRVAFVLWKQGKFAEAEATYREELAMRKKLRGANHAEVATSLRNVALTLSKQEKLTEAEALNREALAMRRKLLGPEHSEIASSLYSLASVLEKQAKPTEAEALYREALAMRRKLLGNEHRDVAFLLNDLGILLDREGRLSEAEVVFREALAIRKKLCGNEPEDVGSSLQWLAYVLREQGGLAEAENLEREDLAVRKKLRGAEHAEVAESLYNVAWTLTEEEKLTEAEALFRQALAMRKKLLGPNHAKTVASLRELAYVLSKEGKTGEAEPAIREALAIQKTLDLKDAELAWTLDLLGRLLQKQGKPAEAGTCYRQAAESYRKAAETSEAEAMNDLAWFLATCTFSGVRDGSNALSFAERAVAATNRKAPDNLGTLAAAYAETGDFERAVSVQKEAIALLKDGQTKKDFTSRLKLYESKTPYRESD